MSRRDAATRPSKRRKLSSPDESSVVDDADLLARLNAHCSTLLGSAAPASLSLEEDEVDGSDEGEWQGFDGETDGEEDGSELDDDTDLLGNVSKAVVQVFDDPSRRRDDVMSNVDAKSFMSSRISRQVASTGQTGVKKSRKEQEEDDEEKRLQSLDVDLATLLKTMPTDPDVIGSSLAPRRNHTAPIQRNTPRLLRQGIERARVKRAKVDAEADRESGAVSAGGKGGPALTKKAMRAQSGAEDKRRREARGLGGVVGRMGPGGTMLRLSADEVRRGNAGKSVDQLIRARKAGGFEGRKRGKAKSFGRQ